MGMATVKESSDCEDQTAANALSMPFRRGRRGERQIHAGTTLWLDAAEIRAQPPFFSL